MKKISLFILTLLMVLNAQAQVARPKLIVGLVVDQMRWDYLYFYQNEYGQGGLRRLLNEGFSFENTQINYAPTVTAIGHSSVFTGSVPALHGICGNNFWQDDQYVYCCTDTTVRSVGSDSTPFAHHYDRRRTEISHQFPFKSHRCSTQGPCCHSAGRSFCQRGILVGHLCRALRHLFLLYG